MKIIQVSKWILPFGYGITLGNWLLVRKDSNNLEYVIEHEKVHFRQWNEEGSYLKWLIKYINYLIKYGYYENPYEVEARVMATSILESRNRNT